MKRQLLCGLLAAASLSCSASGYRSSVPVQVDGTRMSNGYIENGSTYVPLRSLLNALGDWEIRWDADTREVVASSQGCQLTASPADNTVTVNSETLYGTVSLHSGTTYVPLRLVTEALDGTAQWDPYLDGAAVTSAESAYDAIDLYWLSHIIYAESGAESMEGQIAVGNVVLNRVASSSFPKKQATTAFIASTRTTKRALFGPNIRRKLVRPALPLPCSRTSFFAKRLETLTAPLRLPSI